MTIDADHNQDAAISRSRLKLLIVFTLFLGPLIIAVVWYYGFGAVFAPKSAVNNAPLVQPAVPLDPFTNLRLDGEQVNLENLSGRWTMVHRLGSECDDGCVLSLYNTRQTRLALGKDSNRVQRFLLGSDVALMESIAANHADLGLLLNVAGGLNSQLEPIVDSEHIGPHDALLIDPLGNVMMSVPTDLNPSLLLKDLKKLLRLSKIG